MFVIARHVHNQYALRTFRQLEVLKEFDVNLVWVSAATNSMSALIYSKYAHLAELLYQWKNKKSFNNEFANAFIMPLEEAMNIENLNKEIEYD